MSNCGNGCIKDRSGMATVSPDCPVHGQAHAMSHPIPWSVPGRYESEGVQHVSDDAYAAYRAWCPFDPMQRSDYDEAHSSMGTVLRTVAEWQRLRDEVLSLELSAARMHAQMRVKDSIIADLQRQLREVRDGADIRRERSEDPRVRAGGGCADMRGSRLLAGMADPLDARLGRGNAAMGES